MPRPDLSTAYVAPGNRMERVFCDVWQDYLGLTQVGCWTISLNWVRLSLDMIQINQRLKDKIDRDIPVVDMFTYPSIRLLVGHVQDDEKAAVEVAVAKQELPAEPQGQDRNRLKQRRKMLEE